MFTHEELRQKIKEETELIAELEASPVPPEFYKKPDGSDYPYPKGSYAVYVTKIRDAYWRRRNWQGQLADPTYDPATNPG